MTLTSFSRSLHKLSHEIDKSKKAERFGPWALVYIFYRVIQTFHYAHRACENRNWEGKAYNYWVIGEDNTRQRGEGRDEGRGLGVLCIQKI